MAKQAQTPTTTLLTDNTRGSQRRALRSSTSVAAYVRVSPQSDGAARRRRQRLAIRRAFGDRRPTFFEDRGFGEGSQVRPALRALLDLVERGRIRDIVVEDVSRLSRQTGELADLWHVFERARVRLHSVEAGGRLTKADFTPRGFLADRMRERVRQLRMRRPDPV